MAAHGAIMSDRMPWEIESDARDILKRWCELQSEKYGPDWRKKVAAGLAKASAPYIEEIMRLGRQS
jgi:hypothetical protein